MRYRFLETIREYALERDEVSGQAKNGCLRHAAYYRELAATGASTRLGVQYPRDIEVVTQEQANLRAALGAMLGQGELQHGLALCLALGGNYLRLAPGSDQHLNPFDLVPQQIDLQDYISDRSRGDRLYGSPVYPGVCGYTIRPKGRCPGGLYPRQQQAGSGVDDNYRRGVHHAGDTRTAGVGTIALDGGCG